MWETVDGLVLGWVRFPGTGRTRNDNLTVNQFAAVPVPLTSVIGHKVAELIECDSDGFQLGKCHREVPSFNFDWSEVCAGRLLNSTIQPTVRLPRVTENIYAQC